MTGPILNPNSPLGNPNIPADAKEMDFSWLPHGDLSEEQRQAIVKHQGYDKVRQGCESFMSAQQENYAGFFKRCPTHGNVALMWSCRHAEVQDPVHPVGLVIVPMMNERSYFLCTECYVLLEQKRFDIGKEMFTVCEKCIMNTAERVSQQDPRRLQDLRIQKRFIKP